MARRVTRAASQGASSSNVLRQTLNLSISASTVRRTLNGSGNFKYKKMQHAPLLTIRHKQARTQWAHNHVTWSDADWAKVIFSDEKKFNLDGPDGFKHYWYDLRTDPKLFSTRQNGGGSVMIWGGFSARWKTQLVILNGLQDSSKYLKTLQNTLLPFTAVNHGDDYIFQQDNAPIHTSRVTKEWFTSQNMSVFDWPSKSPNLNPIENLSGVFARKVYGGGKQYSDKVELQQCVLDEWQKIELGLLKSLVASMQNRCVEFLEKSGAKTKY